MRKEAEQKANKGQLAFTSKAENIVNSKNDKELLVQARREIDQEWSAARILEMNNSKKEKAEDIMAR